MPKKILVIDDDVDLIEVLRLMLEKNGYLVIDAQNGTRGYQLVEKERPDLIILDVMMATWDEGFEVVQKIRNNPKLAATPIIMLTAVSQQMGIRYDKDKETLPVEEFIEKPVMPGTLLNIIKKYI
ncbi:MAG: response regulator [Candidatus Marinimicrobia bacterium]|nr:response regulator [Candidatus Neomarinimicrobiota bacterium]HNZ37864.1 response regulator [Candidatus Neomarinimicrobiota bacterium]HOG76017.1 response regulator [Candidatus Neomarinimicrobiota bacterium]